MARGRGGINAYLIGSLGGLVAIAALVHGAGEVLPQTLIAVVTACGLDTAIRRTGGRRFPMGALVSGLIVALLLPEGQRWYVPLGAASLALGSKHLLRWRGRNVFNPAAFGVAAAVFVFAGPLQLGHADYLETGPRLYYAQAHLQMEGWSFLIQDGHGWIGSTSALAVIALGSALVHRLRRGELVGAFLATYLVAFAGSGVVTGQELAVRLPLELFAAGVPFFALFMLTDPATSPRSRKGRTVYGAGIALAAFGLRFVVSPVLFLLLALLVANLALAAARRLPRAADDRPAVLTPLLPFGP